MMNINQKNIIENLKTPACIIAGPGCGKTYTIVEKIVHLVKNEGIDAKKIMVSTFTRKASEELIERITEKFKEENININTGEMMISNFHSLALKFTNDIFFMLKDKNEYKIVDSNLENFIIRANENRFSKFLNMKGDDLSFFVSKVVEKIINNVIDLKKLEESNDEKERLCAKIFKSYVKLFQENKLISYSLVLYRFNNLLDDKKIQNYLRDKIDYIIVDEYQDTNEIQQQILFKLLKNDQIMVVGDDDQSLYRFRSSNPNNLVKFNEITKFFLDKDSNFYYLNRNYRSNSEIVDFYTNFISKDEFKDERLNKSIYSKKNKNKKSVYKIKAYDIEKIVYILKEVSNNTDLKNVAFLFPSLKNSYVLNLQQELEKRGINVFNKSSVNFFQRDEIKKLMYSLLKLLCFNDLKENNIKRYSVYEDYLYNVFFNEKIDYKLNDFLNKKNHEIENGLNKDNLSDIFYKILGFSPFKEILDDNLKSFNSIRSQSNISSFIKFINDFSNIAKENRIKVFDKKAVDFYKKFFLENFLKDIFIKKLAVEFEFVEESLSNCVNFLTIHQSKGLEFEICFVSSLYERPRGDFFFLDKYDRFEREKNREKIDFFRKYYTSFSRAKEYLFILDNIMDFNIRKEISGLDYFNDEIKVEKTNPKKEKKVLSFTTDIDKYKKCPRLYKFDRILNFTQIKEDNLLYGTKVHHLVEYLNNAKNNNIELDNDYIEKCFINDKNLISPIENYLKSNIYKKAKYSEKNFKSDRISYILQGNVDIITEDNTLVDIKTGKIKESLMSSYKNQILTYYNLLKLNNIDVNEIYIFYLNENKVIEIEKKALNIKEIDNIANQLLNDTKFLKTKNKNICKFCKYKYICQRNN
ncbi:MAG: ATP-dependent DNA helicase [Peptoniphilaceae bacterium]|nr:ATP-dependent DNA helicase [Peptoniphilaceae bacterium]MDY3737551.1 ATP-dependent DNA helicase [Peptoniphilaceae bacterium]